MSAPSQRSLPAALLSLATSETAPGEVTVSAAGDLDMATCPAFEAEVDAALARGPKRLVLELTGVSFCAVTGVGCLTRALELAREAGADLEVAPSRTVRRALVVTGLAGLFLFSGPWALVSH